MRTVAQCAPAESSPIGALGWIAVLLLAFGASQVGGAVYIHAKAALAQELLHHAWMRTQATGLPAKPWPWADTWPVARLLAPTHDIDLLVLQGASGRTLAFGPGHVAGSALPGRPGNTVFSAHRDTHFRFLQGLGVGDQLIVELPSGERYFYRVTSTAIADQRALKLARDIIDPQLTLVTCYPFDAVAPGGPLRYIVIADAS